MRKSLQTICLTVAFATVSGIAFAQQPATPREQGAPTPSQAGADPSMAKPEGSTLPAANTPPVQNPESTVGLAPADQPVNNMKPNVAGQVVPSSHQTAAHEDSIFKHDLQPTITHTFNFTAEQKQSIVSALSQDKDATGAKNVEFSEATVLPPEVELKALPETIASQMPWMQAYRYVKVGQKIALVEPNHRYIAAVLQ